MADINTSSTDVELASSLINKILRFKAPELRSIVAAGGSTVTGTKARQIKIIKEMIYKNNKKAILKIYSIHCQRYSTVQFNTQNTTECNDRVNCRPVRKSYQTSSPMIAGQPQASLGSPIAIFPPTIGNKFTTICSMFTKAELNQNINKYLLVSHFKLDTASVDYLQTNSTSNIRVIMRICPREITQVQVYDNIPKGVACVKVNQQTILLVQNPEKLEHKYVERPLDLTKHISKNTWSQQRVELTYIANPKLTSSNEFLVAVEIVKFDIDKLVSDIPSFQRQETESKIKQAFCDESGLGITTNYINVSLKCPLTSIIMSMPCRSVMCKHLQCFDGRAYITLGVETQKWVCPICSTIALYPTLRRDEYFIDLISKTPSKDDIYLQPDASWSLTPILSNNHNHNVVVDDDDLSEGCRVKRPKIIDCDVINLDSPYKSDAVSIITITPTLSVINVFENSSQISSILNNTYASEENRRLSSSEESYISPPAVSTSSCNSEYPIIEILD